MYQLFFGFHLGKCFTELVAVDFGIAFFMKDTGGSALEFG